MRTRWAPPKPEMGSDGGGAIQGRRGNVAEANESVSLSIQQPFANHVDICLGALLPDFSDRSGIWARQLTLLHARSPQAEKDQIDCHKTMRIHMHAVSDAKGSRFSLIDIVKTLHSIA